MKKTLLFICKLAASGILALLLLSVFALVYYNPPVAEPQPDKYTNSKFASGVFWTDMTEGIGYGKTNNLGYNEADSFDPAQPAIAMIGSSHTEALQVPQNKNYTAQLQQLLHAAGKTKINCLNLGQSGHFLNISVSNFEYFAEAFQSVDLKCAVIEVGNLNYTPAELEKMLAGAYHSDMQERGTLYRLAQRIPYLRLLYKQFQDSRQKGGAAAETEPFDAQGYYAGVDQVMKKLSGIAAENGFPLVILYHDSIAVQGGKASRQDDPEQLAIFKDRCTENGILFVDVTDRFVEHFNATYELPYGFSNTTMGSGHLNELGHRIIAEELFDHVVQLTEEN